MRLLRFSCRQAVVENSQVSDRQATLQRRGRPKPPALTVYSHVCLTPSATMRTLFFAIAEGSQACQALVKADTTIEPDV